MSVSAEEGFQIVIGSLRSSDNNINEYETNETNIPNLLEYLRNLRDSYSGYGKLFWESNRTHGRKVTWTHLKMDFYVYAKKV